MMVTEDELNVKIVLCTLLTSETPRFVLDVCKMYIQVRTYKLHMQNVLNSFRMPP